MFFRCESAVFAAAMVLVADGVPTFNVESFCRRVAAMSQPFGDVDLCVRRELEAREQLVKQWTQFPAADWAFCRELTTTGADPIYTELLTCLEMRRDARNLRQKDTETTETPRSSNHRALRASPEKPGLAAHGTYGRPRGSLPSQDLVARTRAALPLASHARPHGREPPHPDGAADLLRQRFLFGRAYANPQNESSLCHQFVQATGLVPLKNPDGEQKAGLPPGLRVWVNSVSEMQRFESSRPRLES